MSNVSTGHEFILRNLAGLVLVLIMLWALVECVAVEESRAPDRNKEGSAPPVRAVLAPETSVPQPTDRGRLDPPA